MNVSPEQTMTGAPLMLPMPSDSTQAISSVWPLTVTLSPTFRRVASLKMANA